MLEEVDKDGGLSVWGMSVGGNCKIYLTSGWNGKKRGACWVKGWAF